MYCQHKHVEIEPNCLHKLSKVLRALKSINRFFDQNKKLDTFNVIVYFQNQRKKIYT